MSFFAILFALLLEQVRPLARHNAIHAADLQLLVRQWADDVIFLMGRVGAVASSLAGVTLAGFFVCAVRRAHGVTSRDLGRGTEWR